MKKCPFCAEEIQDAAIKYGADHMLFATDTPYDNQLGERVTRETIAGVQAMPIDEASRWKIFANNARRLFRLPI